VPKLHVEHVDQEETFYCGTAVAEMILKFYGVVEPGPVLGLQDQLWTEVCQLTNGPVRSPNSVNCGGYMATFERQQCYQCNRCACWYTTPQALEAVLSARLKKAVPMAVPVATMRDGTFDPIPSTSGLLDRIDRAAAPVAALVALGDHWVVLHGYQEADEESQPGAVEIGGGRFVVGVYVNDPYKSEPETFVPIDEWLNTTWWTLVACGCAADQDNRVAVTPG